MPSKVLQFQTPYDFCNQCFSTSRISITVPPKIFGCVAFVHIHNQNHGKLALKARKCIFIGYSPTQRVISVLISFKKKNACYHRCYIF